MPDSRSKRQKLQDLANHPRTPKAEAAAAREAIKRLPAEAAGPRPTILSDEMLGKQPAGRQTGPRPYSETNFDFSSYRVDPELYRQFWETEMAKRSASYRRYTSPEATVERDAARERARRLEEENHRMDSPLICPGCSHRSELHFVGDCFQCGQAQPQTHCDWVYTGYGPQFYGSLRRPGWTRTQ